MPGWDINPIILRPAIIIANLILRVKVQCYHNKNKLCTWVHQRKEGCAEKYVCTTLCSYVTCMQILKCGQGLFEYMVTCGKPVAQRVQNMFSKNNIIYIYAKLKMFVTKLIPKVRPFHKSIEVNRHIENVSISKHKEHPMLIAFSI